MLEIKTETKTRGAPLGSHNRLGKFKQDGATSFLHIRCKPADKANWVRAAGGDKLAEWVIRTLNEQTVKEAL